MAPPNSRIFSVSVVLPASGCEMIAKVRRRATGSGSVHGSREGCGKAWRLPYPASGARGRARLRPAAKTLCGRRRKGEYETKRRAAACAREASCPCPLRSVRRIGLSSTRRSRRDFANLLAWRRDVRRFRRDDGSRSACSQSLLDLTPLAPSVGNCQPTRWVRVDDAAPPGGASSPISRRPIKPRWNPMTASGRETYARLKLAGLREAPVHLAVFCDEGTSQGHGLGARTMPQTRRYSAVCALHTFWLAARMHGLGVGWVSILEPEPISRDSRRARRLVASSPISAWAGRRRSMRRRNSSAKAGRRGSPRPCCGARG